MAKGNGTKKRPAPKNPKVGGFAHKGQPVRLKGYGAQLKGVGR